MPRRKDTYKEIQISVSQEAVEEALARWIKTEHGIDVDRKMICIVLDEADNITATITKPPQKPIVKKDDEDDGRHEASELLAKDDLVDTTNS